LHEGGHEAGSTHRGRTAVLGSSDRSCVEVIPLLGGVGELLHDEVQQLHDKGKERKGLDERDALDRHFAWIVMDGAE